MNTNISINQNSLKFCIYRISNKINNKSYIGQHSYQGSNPMSDKHGDQYLGSGTLLRESYKKYGVENFSYEVLVSEITSKEEIDQLEKEYIFKERELKGKENVYNISDGGTGGKIWGDKHPNLGKKYYNNGTEQVYCYECPEGFVEGSLFKRSEEQKRLISEYHKGEKNCFYGKKWYHTLDGEEKILSIEEVKSDSKWIPGRIKGKRIHYRITEEDRERRRNRMKGHKFSSEMKQKISNTVKNTCSSPEWKREHSERTKEGMKKVESMSSIRDRYNEVKKLGLLPLLGIFQDHWNNFRKYESIHGKVDIDKIKKDSL